MPSLDNENNYTIITVVTNSVTRNPIKSKHYSQIYQVCIYYNSIRLSFVLLTNNINVYVRS